MKNPVAALYKTVQGDGWCEVVDSTGLNPNRVNINLLYIFSDCPDDLAEELLKLVVRGGAVWDYRVQKEDPNKVSTATRLAEILGVHGTLPIDRLLHILEENIEFQNSENAKIKELIDGLREVLDIQIFDFTPDYVGLIQELKAKPRKQLARLKRIVWVEDDRSFDETMNHLESIIGKYTKLREGVYHALGLASGTDERVAISEIRLLKENSPDGQVNAKAFDVVRELREEKLANTGLRQRVKALTAEVEAWKNDARRFARNADFHRDVNGGVLAELRSIMGLSPDKSEDATLTAIRCLCASHKAVLQERTSPENESEIDTYDFLDTAPRGSTMPGWPDAVTELMHVVNEKLAELTDAPLGGSFMSYIIKLEHALNELKGYRKNSYPKPDAVLQDVCMHLGRALGMEEGMQLRYYLDRIQELVETKSPGVLSAGALTGIVALANTSTVNAAAKAVHDNNGLFEIEVSPDMTTISTSREKTGASIQVRGYRAGGAAEKFMYALAVLRRQKSVGSSA